MSYTLDDIELIKNKNFNIKISEDVINVIKNIADMVGSNNYIKTPTFKKESKLKKFRNTQVINNNNEIINNIKLILNKISVNNYEEHFYNISNIIIKNPETKEDIYNVILKEIIRNKINLPTFVLLIKLLHGNFDWMLPLYNTFIQEKCDKICNFNYSSSDNYELFCKINNENEERIIFLNFIVLLHKNNMINISIINNIIEKFIEIFNQYLNTDKYYIIEQICCCLVILLNDYYVILNNKIKTGVDNMIDLISKSNNNSYEGLTNKSIFKILDFQENILNNI